MLQKKSASKTGYKTVCQTYGSSHVQEKFQSQSLALEKWADEGSGWLI
jgi:hypothetical protein